MTGMDSTKRLSNIEGALERVFPSQTDLGWAQRVADQEHLVLRTEDLDRINAPAWDLLRRGGKRWRPLVLTLSHELHGGTLASIADLSTLVELPHNGSLIVDDIEDSADQRRGGPAIHVAHGIDMAVNTGNFLYFEPTFLLEHSGLDDAAQFRMMKLYLRVMRRLHFGQGLDIVWHNDHDYLPNRDQYLQMCRFKTGALSRLSAELGAASAGASDAEVEALGSVWEDLGVGFQILDDVKNLTEGNPGKLRGDDIVEGKKSLPVLCHAEEAPDHGLALLGIFRRVADLRPAPEIRPLIEQAIGLMESSGGLRQAYEVGEGLLTGARKRLVENWSAGPARRGMEDLLESFWEGLR
jgi:octaprenyl-diphosphate synthase